MSDKTVYWVDISDYDLGTADAMFRTGRYLYVGFMCHQVIEKILKGLYTKQTGLIPPYTHSLAYLAQKTGLLDILNEQQKDFLLKLEPLNIEARYPADKEKMTKELTEPVCISLLKNTSEL